MSAPNTPISLISTRSPKTAVPGSLLALFALAFALLSLFFGMALPPEADAEATGVELAVTAALQHSLPHSLPVWRSSIFGAIALLLMVLCSIRALKSSGRVASLALAVGSLIAGGLWLLLPPARGDAVGAAGFWLGAMALAFLAVVSVQRNAQFDGNRSDEWLSALVAGLWVLFFWQLLVTALGVPRVILPAPASIVLALMEHSAVLLRDFNQTVVKSVVTGWLMGCGLGFAVAIAIDRQPFLQRGLLPIAALTSTVPLVGVAPIMVMWFGFDWPSKAAVVVLMTFFPMLVSTLAGLKASDKLEQELMYTYAAGYRRTLLDLRLPAAFPFIVGAMKVNASLALIGAIVAEFFGSPTSGLGFRISTEAARMNMSLVWGAIVVSAVTGSVAYALLVRLERRIAFWHPSVRGR